MNHSQQIENAKAGGKYRFAGQLAALFGHDRNYGCHYGMNSSLSFAKHEYTQGYNEVNFYLTSGNV